MKTGRTLPTADNATFRFTTSHAVAAMNVSMKSAPWLEYRQEDGLVADFAEPQPVRVEAQE